MPLPLLPLIALGLTAAGTAGSIWSSNRQSKKNMQLQMWQNEQNWLHQNQMYDKQRADALADWNSQNAYNHPLEQMNRLRQAGLNPHLVYGKGADATAESIRASAAPSQNAPAPQSTFQSTLWKDVSSPINAMYDLNAKQAQIDNLHKQGALMQQEALFKQASTAKTIQDTSKSSFELDQAKQLKDSVIENAKLQNDKLRADTMYTLDSNRRQELANSSNVKLTLEKILTEKIAHAKDQTQIDFLKAQIENVKQNTAISVYERQLTEMGIHKSDPWYFRALMNLVNGNMNSSIPSALQGTDIDASKTLWDKLTGGSPTHTATRIKK